MGRISSYFGKRETLNGRTQHDGLDFPAPVGSPIYSNKELTVLQSKTETGYGNVVMARDNAGNIYKFAHLDSVPENIKPGAKIQPGEQIAWTGISGVEKDGKQTSTGPHLHYEVIQGKKAVDPLTTVDTQGQPFVNAVSFSPNGGNLRNTEAKKDPNYTPNGTATAPLRPNQNQDPTAKDPTGRPPTTRGLKPDVNQSPAETNRLNKYAPPPPAIRAPMINPLLQLGDR